MNLDKSIGKMKTVVETHNITNKLHNTILWQNVFDTNSI
jgi:hypothetical protein